MLDNIQATIANKRLIAANMAVSPKGRMIRYHIAKGAVMAGATLVTWQANKTLAEVGQEMRVALIPIPKITSALMEPRDPRNR